MSRGALPAGISIRAIGADDVLPLERFYAALSPDALDARFHGGTRGIEDRAARMFCGPDHVHREGLVAVKHRARGAETILVTMSRWRSPSRMHGNTTGSGEPY
jgi:hypothetical protein